MSCPSSFQKRISNIHLQSLRPLPPSAPCFLASCRRCVFTLFGYTEFRLLKSSHRVHTTASMVSLVSLGGSVSNITPSPRFFTSIPPSSQGFSSWMESSPSQLHSSVFSSCPVCSPPSGPRIHVHRPTLLDLPSNTRPNFIYTERQVEIGKNRMEEIGRQPPAKFTRKKVLGFFTTWHIWFLTPRNLASHPFLSEQS